LQPKKGFSLVELLLVIAVIAVLATLTIGGVMKSIQSSREKHIDAMCNALRLALVNYRAQEGRWPCKLEPGTKNGSPMYSSGQFESEENRNRVIFTRENNRDVFRPLIPTKGAKKGFYISPSEFLTKVGGRVMSLREAVDQGASSPPLGYANPNKRSEFLYFGVEFNLATDSVKVRRQQGGD